MNIVYLLPPSEWKNAWGHIWTEILSFSFEKPHEIAISATQKDLKCTGKRYEEGISMNKKIAEKTEVLSAIFRYSWVMYSAISYNKMTEKWKKYFDENFLILSGMYGILKPQDMISNYKLPIETKWLREFWGDRITRSLNTLEADIIVDLLPNSYKKMIDWKNIIAQIVRIDFYSEEWKKLTHGVKKVKWDCIREICEKWYTNISDFSGERVQISENEYHISITV